jgi:hypothetical protein
MLRLSRENVTCAKLACRLVHVGDYRFSWILHTAQKARKLMFSPVARPTAGYRDIKGQINEISSAGGSFTRLSRLHPSGYDILLALINS